MNAVTGVVVGLATFVAFYVVGRIAYDNGRHKGWGEGYDRASEVARTFARVQVTAEDIEPMLSEAYERGKADGMLSDAYERGRADGIMNATGAKPKED